ncbi:MAG: CoA transferase, partial [Dehalococcoidia bacterium]|nr:CoA transferase [Dehalococcoidia bacterium]
MTTPDRALPLTGRRVLDAATILAGPLMAQYLGDFGADVIKIEHPRGDSLRTHGHTKHGVGLWWKIVGRNKRAITLNFSHPDGQRLLLELVKTADVFIENFRPGTLEKWGLGPDRLHAVNPGLIIMRTTGFGQFGPYASRPGFGTIAESMSGFAHITGEPDGPPTLPPFGLADGIAGLAGAYAIMMALYHRDVNGGKGQVIDLAIIEPIFALLGPQATVYDQLGVIQQRSGNRSVNNAPRNTYKTRDGKWVAISTSAQSIAERVMRLVGHPEVIEEPWFKSGTERAKHADLLDSMVGGWIAQHDLPEVLDAFEKAEAAIAPIYDIADIMADPQYQALNTIITVDDPTLGPIKMPNVMFRMSATPGQIRWTG